MDILDRFVTVDGLRIHYLLAGPAGSPLLLLHGAGIDCARLSWGDVIGPLAEAGHQVYAPDVPGYGDSDRPDVRYGIDYYVSFLDGLMAVLGFGRVTLAGLSMGGAIALGTALRWPERVECLVLVDSYGIQRTVPMHRLSYLVVRIPGLMEATYGLTRRRPAMARATLGNVLYDAHAASPALMAEIDAELRKPAAGRAAIAFQRDDLLWSGLRTDYIDRLSQVRVPTLLVHGRQDRVVPLRWAEQAQRLIAGSQLQVIDGAGHWVQRDRPDEFVRVVSGFLDAHDG